MLLPGKYCIYKGARGKNGALQFSIISSCLQCSENDKHKVYRGNPNRPGDCPFRDDNTPCGGKLSFRCGVVLLEGAPTIGINKYDWRNGIRVAFSVGDISKFLIGFRTGVEVKLYHDPMKGSSGEGKVVKNIVFSSPKGLKEGGVISMSQITKIDDRKEKKGVTVGILPDELVILTLLFSAAIPKLLAWN